MIGERRFFRPMLVYGSIPTFFTSMLIYDTIPTCIHKNLYLIRYCIISVATILLLFFYILNTPNLVLFGSHPTLLAAASE